MSDTSVTMASLMSSTSLLLFALIGFVMYYYQTCEIPVKPKTLKKDGTTSKTASNTASKNDSTIEPKSNTESNIASNIASNVASNIASNVESWTNIKFYN